MSEGHDQEHPAEGSALPPMTEQTVAEGPQSARPAGGSWQTVWWLTTLLLLVIAGVGLSPFWARDVALLLPWGSRSAPPAQDYAALAARMVAIENRPAPPPAEDYAELAARVAAVEKRPAPPPPDIAANPSTASALARRVDQLETARDADRQTDAVVSGLKVGLQQLEERLSALEARSAARANSETAEFEKLRAQLSQIGSISSDLADRLPAIERRIGAAGKALRTDSALLAALLQLRDAVEASRTFATEYDAFIALAHDQPDLIAAAKPLAELAQAGVAGNAVLSEHLGQLSGRIVPAAAPPTDSDLQTHALAWLHSLVTIRRTDAASQTGQGPAINVAEGALVRGDLPGAVSALQTLPGPASGAIQSWLQMAQQRLVAENTLAHLQDLLVARLSTHPEAPEGGPTEVPTKSAQPS
jgi:hypothetical protein